MGYMNFGCADSLGLLDSFSHMNNLANSPLWVLDVIQFFSYAILLIHRWVLQRGYYSEDIPPIMNRVIG